MQLKCNRFVFSYQSSPEEVESFILRSADLAEQTYGRDAHFSRLNQVLDQARFLGWKLPNFGQNLPDEFTEIPIEGIDHIFENQAKLLVDVAPVTRVLLENGSYCPTRMICGTTPAGDLVWRNHLLVDEDGCPYVQKDDKRYRVKTKGTKIVSQTDTLPYDENYITGCFGGEKGYWPVPFLPEFFLDRPVALIFRPEKGVVEVVKIEAEIPVCVLARKMVPWYQAIEIDRTRALPLDDYRPVAEFDKFHPPSPNLNNLVSGWDELQDNEQFELDEDGLVGSDDYEESRFEEEAPSIVNIITAMSTSEYRQYQKYEKEIQTSGIASKEEAESLLKDPRHKGRAEDWLSSVAGKLRLLANFSSKLGAALSLIEKHPGQQILIIQPRQKWAAKLADILRKKGCETTLFDSNRANVQLPKFYEGRIPILITSHPIEELFIEDLIIISVSSFNTPQWLEWINPTQLIYSIATEQLGYTDHNLVTEHPMFDVHMEPYTGPICPILDVEEKPKQRSKSLTPPPTPPSAKPPPSDPEKKEKKIKYKVRAGKGRPKTVSTYDKAMELVRKNEEAGKRCEVYSSENSEALYITGIGELK